MLKELFFYFAQSLFKIHSIRFSISNSILFKYDFFINFLLLFSTQLKPNRDTQKKPHSNFIKVLQQSHRTKCKQIEQDLTEHSSNNLITAYQNITENHQTLTTNLQNPKSNLSKLHSNFIKTQKKLIKISQQAAQQQEDGTEAWVCTVVTGLRVVAPTVDTSITLFAQTFCLNKPWPAIEIVRLAGIGDTMIVQLRCRSGH